MNAKHPNGFVVKPLCTFCNAPWTDDMIEIEANVSESCDTCGYGGGSYGTITISCPKCENTIYQKDFDNRG
jgi:hypothetical protein